MGTSVTSYSHIVTVNNWQKKLWHVPSTPLLTLNCPGGRRFCGTMRLQSGVGNLSLSLKKSPGCRFLFFFYKKGIHCDLLGIQPDYHQVASTLNMKFKASCGRQLTEENLKFLAGKAFRWEFTLRRSITDEKSYVMIKGHFFSLYFWYLDMCFEYFRPAQVLIENSLGSPD